MKKIIVPLLALASLGNAHATQLLTAGETDFGLLIEDGMLEFEAHVVGGILDNMNVDDEEFPLSDIIVVADASRARTVPSDAFAPTGVATGETFWFLDQNITADLTPFPALAVDELNITDWTEEFISISLGEVTAPSDSGEFSTWFSTLSGPDFVFSTADPSATDANNTFAPTNHHHMNWGFSEPGVWTVELLASGTHNDLGPLVASGTVTFNVIPEPSSTLLIALSALGLISRRRR